MLRTYGRVYDAESNPIGWQVVTTDANGFDDYVWITTLIQCFLLFLGESPFYAQYGIPAKATIVSQTQPDFYISRLQQLFAPKFANLAIAKVQDNPPTYNVAITTHQGTKVTVTVYVPSSG
jgi:hypothetical protein